MKANNFTEISVRADVPDGGRLHDGVADGAGRLIARVGGQ